MTTFWEIAAHSVDRIFSFVILVIFHFGFEVGTLVPIALVPGHCLPFTFYPFSLMRLQRHRLSILKTMHVILLIFSLIETCIIK